MLIERSRAFGRQLLSGISHYADLHYPCEFCMEPEFYRLSGSEQFWWTNIVDAHGVIAHTWNPKVIEMILDSGLPAVICGIPEPKANACRILTNELAVGSMAAEYLLERGFQRFAFCGFDDMVWSRKRGEYFSRRVGQAGFEVYFYKQPRHKKHRLVHNERPVIAKWLKSLPRPIAILACCDDRTHDVLDACKLADLEVPDEVAILGVDNDELVCRLSCPQISSLALGTERAGYEAAKVLEKLMTGGKITTSERTIENRPLYIVTRESTDVLAVEDREVAAAVRFIREHVRETITVGDVAQAATLSRRTLEQRFRRVRGHSVFEEIKRVRLDQLAHMLVDTNLPIAQIAAGLQFPDTANLSRWFKRESGMNPSEYRKRFGAMMSSQKF